ncbi:hypothetical protein K443DRAFT_115885, partial [Laccaria amethystina LaAM-08-1]
DALLVLNFGILRINDFGIDNCFDVLQVSIMMVVPLSRSQIGPCLKYLLRCADYLSAVVTLSFT